APDEEDEDSSNEGEAFEVAEDDLLYARLEDLLVGDDVPEPSYASGDLPPAFSEDPLLRRAYIQAFIASAFHGATHSLVHYVLDGQKQNLVSLSQRAGYDIPGIENMARTLRTVERRLGVDPDEHIIYYYLCTHCWARLTASELKELPSGACTEPGCDGLFYKLKTLSDGKKQRIPLKPLPTASLIAGVQRILLRPNKIAEFDQWREAADSDAPGPEPPLTEDDWPGWNDHSFRLHDMFDGWRWRNIRAGLERRQGGEFGVEDVEVIELEQRFVSLPLGLVLIINIDWYRGKYSVGAVYCTIANNPRAKRFLQEETILLAIIPGPEEPSLEQLNSILEVFVAEAQRLYSGKCQSIAACTLTTYGLLQATREPCHAYLNIVAADLPGSRKATGLRGHTSERFMCAVCKQTFNSLVDHACFDQESFEYRSDERYLKYAFKARHADAATRTEITERRGIRWSILNVLPDWMPARDSPPDFMHAAYLGEAKHVVQGILVGGGMFTKRKANKPLERFQTFLENVWLPGTFNKVSTNLLTGAAGKADSWRIMTTYLPVALYYSWQVGGMIPDVNAPRPKSGEKAAAEERRITALVNGRRRAHALQEGNVEPADLEYMVHETADRNYRTHYDAVLNWCVAMRIWASRSITVDEISRAHDCHMFACQAWTRMLCHLTPYFHLMMHM
ncbi:hypothetical protein BC628DRAFT_1333482, partial [Trametes gibbosa]